jgi:tRNA threonylcarbamoyladenosine biosynthesis protein TsaB
VLLAFDTSTEWISVAVYDAEAGATLASKDNVGPMKHGELLAPTIAASLEAAGLVRQDLTALVVGVGPGPYTGLRVGVVTALTMGLALEIPAYGVCSLDAMAYHAVQDGVAEAFLVTSDARRKELFWASYDGEGRRLEGPFVDRPADITVGELAVLGHGPLLYPDHFPRSGGPTHPSAVDLAAVVATEWVQLYDPEPIYLRRPDAVTPGPPKKVS